MSRSPTYVSSSGTLQQSRPWSLGFVTDFLWEAVNFVNLFFRSLFNMDGGSRRGQYGNSGGPSQRVPGGRRMGGVSRFGGVAAPPCAPGGG